MSGPIIKNYWGGGFHDALGGGTLNNTNPATGEDWGTLPDSTKADVDQAVEAAIGSGGVWALLPVEERSAWLNKIADGIAARFEEFVQAESQDSGKPLSLAREVDIPRSIHNFQFFAAAATQFASESHHQAGNAIHYTLRQPVGVVAAISPWNLPLYLFSWKIAPALAAGCTVVAKPSEVTPFTAYLLSEVCREIGLPAGVLNIIHGTGGGCGTHMVEHPGVAAVTFTGSTRAGKEIASRCAPLLRKVSLELGGKNPVIIFDDCDYDRMLETTVRGAFRNQGQICLCGSRVYVQRSIYQKFKADFIKATSQLVVGAPNVPSTQIGAIVSEMHYQKILGYLQRVEQEGGKILCGGETIQVPGWGGRYLSPAVIEVINNACALNQEEIFGPVVSIMPFDTEEDALLLANASNYGLASVIWTNHISRAHRFAENVKSGIVWINCWMHRDLRTPFGGMRESGIGREGGWEAMRFFTEAKNVTVKY